MSAPRLLIATVGGAHEPVAASILHWRPARAVFIVSPQTRDSVAATIVPLIQNGGWRDFDAGRYDLHVVGDAQDYTQLVAQIGSLESRVAAWQLEHLGAEVIADLTGGTKPMSAALALAAARWFACKIAYVGGTERSKDGVGIVISGKEQVVDVPNPWEALGLLALEEAIVLFNHGNFSAAVGLLEATRNRTTDPARKREFNALRMFCELCERWDRFQHREALSSAEALRREKNDLRAILGDHRCAIIQAWIDRAQKELSKLIEAKETPGFRHALVADLLGNAQRRIEQGAFDDGVARLYRALEALAQIRLHAHGFNDTGKVPLDQVPEPLRGEWQGRARDGAIMLGLQEDYALLAALGDDLADRFTKAGLADRQRSPLVSRNSSILAHGFAPVGENAAHQLFDAALTLASLTEAALTVFPSLKN